MITYTDAAARSLHDPASYIQGVLGTGVAGAKRQMSRVLPYPLLTAGLLLMWMLLTSFSSGSSSSAPS